MRVSIARLYSMPVSTRLIFLAAITGVLVGASVFGSVSGERWKNWGQTVDKCVQKSEDK